MLVTSIECDTLSKKNIDLQEELRLIDEKLKSMSVKYNSLEVSPNLCSLTLIIFIRRGLLQKRLKKKGLSVRMCSTENLKRTKSDGNNLVTKLSMT